MKITSFIFGVVFGVVLSIGGYYLSTSINKSDNEAEVAGVSIDETKVESQIIDNEVLFTNFLRTNGFNNRYQKNTYQEIVQIINSQSELEKMWLEIYKDQLAPPMPGVDFKNQSVLIAMSAKIPEGEHLLTIQDILNSDPNIVVKAQLKGPGEGCLTNNDSSRPLHIVLTKKLQNQTATISIKEINAAPCVIPLN